MLNEENLAHKKLVVGGLQVIGSMEGGGLEEVKIQVDALQNSVNTQRQKVDDYWSQISGDGVINPTEKKQLKKEWEIIDATHYALMQLAESKGLLDTKDIIACDDNYKALKKYLFETLRLFENMAESTPLADVEVFNSYYSEYYYTLQNAQARVTIGDPGKIRLLPSLMEEGYDGEVALYDNQFYFYDARDREWIGISVASKLGEYQGVLTASPPQIPNQYFLVGPEGINTDFLVFNFDQGRAGEESAWTDEDGNVIYINYGFETGFIYFWSEDNEFVKVEDKDNWRYVIAMSDMLKCGYGISPTLAAWLDIHIQDAVDDKTKELAEDILNREPKYWGQRTTKPADKDVHDKDWLTWAGGNSGIFVKGRVYMATVVDVGEYLDVKWTELSATDKDGLVRDRFMSALSDILEVNPTQTGYFSTVFTNSFFAFQGTMDNLQVLQLELRNGGYIKGGYVANQSGFIIKDNGHAEFNDIAIGGGLRTELDGINSKAGSAASAAATAQSAADTAQRTANTAWSEAQNNGAWINDIVGGQVALSRLHGDILQDASDPNNWAIRTSGFDPTLVNAKGFGITKGGNIYANNGVFRGDFYVKNFIMNVSPGDWVLRGFYAKGGYEGENKFESYKVFANGKIRVRIFWSATTGTWNFNRIKIFKKDELGNRTDIFHQEWDAEPAPSAPFYPVQIYDRNFDIDINIGDRIYIESNATRFGSGRPVILYEPFPSIEFKIKEENELFKALAQTYFTVVKES
mgnify:CR=1 FL=1